MRDVDNGIEGRASTRVGHVQVGEGSGDVTGLRAHGPRAPFVACLTKRRKPDKNLVQERLQRRCRRCRLLFFEGVEGLSTTLELFARLAVATRPLPHPNR